MAYQFDKAGNDLSELLKNTAVSFVQSSMADAPTLDQLSVLVGAPVQTAALAFRQFHAEGKNGPDDFKRHVEQFVEDNRAEWFAQ